MFSIGEFARLGRVTVKALRHYDRLGVLRPAFVDRHTGYRFYDAAQIPVIEQLLVLREVGLSLADIGRVRADPAALAPALARRADALGQAIAADRAALARVEALLAIPHPPLALRVRERSIPPQLVLAAEERVTPGDGRTTAMFEALEARSAHADQRGDGKPFLLFDPHACAGSRQVVACVPLAASGKGVPGARLIAGHPRAGTVLYRGSYMQTAEFAAGLSSWARARGATVTGCWREVYHRFGADQRGYRLPARVLAARAEDYVTELQVPIEETSPC